MTPSKPTCVSIALIDPPLYDCRAPHLACAILAASLMEKGFERVKVMDLNIQAVLWLLESRSLEKAREKVARLRRVLINKAVSAHSSGSLLSERERLALWRALSGLRCGSEFPETVKQAVNALRDKELFFQPSRHRAARAVIDAALDLQALACDERLFLSLCPQIYSGPYSATSLAGLFSAIEDRKHNLFLPFYEQKVIPDLFAWRPSVVGLSISNVFQAIPGLTLARLLWDSGFFVVIGGTFFSKFRPQLSKLSGFFELCHAVVVGEGEEPLADIARTVSQKGKLHGIPNIIFREGKNVVVTPIRRSALMPPTRGADFRTLPLEQYFCPEPVLPIYGGKGCDWSRCSFCEIQQINIDFGKKRRTRDPQSIVREMKLQNDRHGARHFVFTDESLEPGHLGDIAGHIGRAGLDVNYLGYTRFSDVFDDRLCRRLAKSGCRKLLFGLESGCQTVNDRCRKGVDLRKVPGIIDSCQNNGIAVHIFSIVGLPGEGEKEIKTSARYLRSLAHRLRYPMSSLDVSPFYLNWNSWLRRNARQLGIQYRSEQDFPLHADEYRLDHGMSNETSVHYAQEIYEQLCWESSALGVDIGYKNPLWPGWEEYTLLYLAKLNQSPESGIPQWPLSESHLLDREVKVAESLALFRIPFSLYDLAEGKPVNRASLIALAPSSNLVEMSKREYGIMKRHSRLKIGELVRVLSGHSESKDACTDALAQVINLLHSGILEW